MLTQTDFIIRLFAGGILGGLIGLERQIRNQPAGLRTHIILVLGATLAMCVSINLSMQFQIETVTKVFLNQDFDALVGALSKMDGLSEFKFQ